MHSGFGWRPCRTQRMNGMASDWRGPDDGCGMRAMVLQTAKRLDRGKLLQLWDGMFTATKDGQMSPVAQTTPRCVD
jgi:hypothetical protein